MSKPSMTTKKALRILNDIVKRANQKIAFEANFAHQYPDAANDMQRRALKTYQERVQAMSYVEDLLEQVERQGVFKL